VDVRRLIRRKRAGEELSAADIDAFVSGVVSGEVDPEQIAALLMAGVIRGFSTAEAVALPGAMVRSGRTLELSRLGRPTVDKHSTGGVGDTATLVVAPLVVAAGQTVVKLSGRSLGHTGGTLDKLESIPGMRVDLTADELLAQADRIGLAVAAASADLAPADARLYSIRDATETVDDVALVAASVMSKKIAGGAHHILLDVKTGGGAFFNRLDDARDLAALCVRIGQAHGRRVGAAISDMSQPLGAMVGNALEVAAAVEVLRGERSGRLRDLSCDLAARALVLVGHGEAEARARIDGVLADGSGLEALRSWVAAQGGDPSVADDPWAVLPSAAVVSELRSLVSGAVVGIGCRTIGEIAAVLGAGRGRRGASVDPSVGVEMRVSLGDEVDAGEVLARVHAAGAGDADRALAALQAEIEIGDGSTVEPPPLVYETL
jgi:pyrimidine-nucleoside phosphorylase